MRELEGKVAVITGGAGGIGLAMAEAFGAAGMKLVIGDIEAAALDRAVAGLRARGFEAEGVRCDVSVFGDVERLGEAALDRFGKLHVAVNNAGVSQVGPIWSLSLDDWRWVLDVNLWGVVHGVKAFTPLQMRHGEEGHTVIVASEAAFMGIGHHAPYCASKAGALALAGSLSSELQAHATRIGCSVVCPGFVDTQIHRSWRNRPAGDETFQDMSKADAETLAQVDAFQGAGASPADVAAVTLEAIRENRFWVFNSPHWRRVVAAMRDNALSGENPPVHTWGPDLRDPEARGPSSLPSLTQA